VGSGYSKGELLDTLERLKDLWQDTRPPNVFVTKEKPDVWLLPEKSLIAEVINTLNFHNISNINNLVSFLPFLKFYIQ